jgi:Protein of unknown function (DUF4058)/Protein of unknown function (DUF2934)
MPSPFPGMDPFLEEPDVWPAFQHHLLACLHSTLVPGLVSRYQAAVGTRRYGAETEDFLEIRQRSDGALITLIELVSPANKTSEAGRAAYLQQRRQALEAKANTVEIDLLMGGRPTLSYSREGLPKFHYVVTVTRSNAQERYEIYTATLQKRLPRFRLPLAADDRDTVLNLQAAFTRCFDVGGFAGHVDYRRELPDALDEDNRAWVEETLVSQGVLEPLAHEDIAVAAYHAWEQEGLPYGRDKDHWRLARAHLRKKGPTN